MVEMWECRFNAVLAAIRPAEFEACLLSWITALHEITDGQLVVCASSGKKGPIMRVTATSAAAKL